MLSQCQSIDTRGQEIENVLKAGVHPEAFGDLMLLSRSGVVRSIIGLQATHRRELSNLTVALSRLKPKLDPYSVTYI